MATDNCPLLIQFEWFASCSLHSVWALLTVRVSCGSTCNQIWSHKDGSSRMAHPYMLLQSGLVCLQAQSSMEHKGDTGRVDRTGQDCRRACAHLKPNPNMADIPYSY